MEKIIVRKPTAAEAKEAAGWPVWNKEVSEFPSEYEEKETCWIMEGKASVKGAEGQVAHFGAGDWVVFPKGLVCVWKVERPVSKHYKFG